METNLALISPKLSLGLISPLNPTNLSTKQCFGPPPLPSKPTGSNSTSRTRSKTTLLAFSIPNSRRRQALNCNDDGKRANKVELFASTSPKGSNVNHSSLETASVGVNPQPYAPPRPSQIGSPLFWIGVGVGFSALFSFVASRVKNYAMQQALKTMMGQMGTQNSQFSNTGFPSGSPFGYPPPYASGPSGSSGFSYPPPPSTVGPSTTSSFSLQSSGSGQITSSASTDFSTTSQATYTTSEADVVVDVSTSNVETRGPEVVKDEVNIMTNAKQSAFVDVSPEEALLKSPFEDINGSSKPAVSSAVVVAQNGATTKESTTSKEETASGKQSSVLSVEALEKMMEDPTVQKMVYPHLPEEMRNPATFKWMLQNPVYRQQLQEMLENMGGNPAWDNRMMETLKNFDLNSPEVREQFGQLGVTPEEVITKIMSNPDLARGFQNPRVQQAMMECSQNPWNISKYQNDKEVMDVITKLSQLFPVQDGPSPF